MAPVDQTTTVVGCQRRYCRVMFPLAELSFAPDDNALHPPLFHAVSSTSDRISPLKTNKILNFNKIAIHLYFRPFKTSSFILVLKTVDEGSVEFPRDSVKNVHSTFFFVFCFAVKKKM
jgi:hypothetical protein